MMASKTTLYSRVQPTSESLRPQGQPVARSWSLNRNQSFIWMLLSLFGGAAFSVGHHYFYANFDGLQVDGVSIDQTWIIRIGTGFAFVAKTLLVVATSIAFDQQQWLTLSRSWFKIRQIDTMTGVLENALSLLESRIWLRLPLLTFLAGIAWLLPIGAVITPATLTVVARDEITNILGSPPRLYYDPSFYGNLQTLVRSDYLGPSPDTLRTAYGSAMTGQMLGISQTHPNMTYTLKFLGPALRCDYADETLINEVYKSYMDSFTGIENEYHYMAWVPPMANNPGNLSKAFRSGDDLLTIDLLSLDTAHLYVIPNTSVSGPVFVSGIPITPEDAHYGYQDLLDCKLYNASYETLFNFTFPTQSITVELRELLNPVNASADIGEWHHPTGSPDVVAREAQRICYQSIMDSFGRLLVGYEWWRDGFVATSTTSWNMLAIDWTTRDGAQTGLEQLFQNITLSMLATSPLTMNSTLAEQNQVLVSTTTSVNIYSYDPRDLWLAYGIACGVTLVATILGTIAMWRNDGVGYRSTFSTFIRVTRDQGLQDLIEPHDNGSGPLPKTLAETRIMLKT